MPAFHLYPQDKLPGGFLYPAAFEGFARTGDYPAIYPWWFVNAASEAGELFYSIRRHDGRNLVPFAKVDDDRDDIACFDGDDSSGNPEVLMLILDDSGRHYSFKDFEDWLSAARRDASGG